MVHLFLAAPFTDTTRAAQFAAVRAALAADDSTDSLLLGNLVLEDGAAPLDAVVVRPHGITLLVLVPRGGVLGIPALGYGGWQLAGAPLAGTDDFDNPFEQFRQQKAALTAWLRPRFTPAQANLQFVSGVVVFEAPLTFGPDVEAALNDAPAGFQLLAGPADLPRRLRQLATPEIDLTAADLAEWAVELNEFAAAAPPTPVVATAASADASQAGTTPEAAAAAASSFLSGKARALWGWLGANDVPDDDLPYGAAAALTASNEEKKQLEQLRQQMQADVQAQLQALETREAERERSIAQLRAELAQAPPVAADATALVSRLGAETREKAALEAEMDASKAELAARNQELDAKIQQLGQLIGQLSAVPAASAVATPAPQEASPPQAAAAVALPVASPPPVAAALVSSPALPPAAANNPTTAAAAAPPAPAVSAGAPVVPADVAMSAAAGMADALPREAGATVSASASQGAVPKAEPASSHVAPLLPVIPVPAATAAAVVEQRGAPRSAPASAPGAPAAAPAAGPVALASLAATISAMAAPLVADGSPITSNASTTAPVAERLRLFSERARAAGAAAVPHFQQFSEAVRARPRVLLGAAGVVVLLLVVWLFTHRSSTAPVPYQENGRWGYADASGTPVIKPQFASAAPFEGGQAAVEKDGAFGLVDEAGKEVVAPAYDAINPYHGGYARVRVGEAYTFLEKGGQEFDHYFFNALDFAEGHAAVLDHRGWFYISGPEVPEKPVIFREAYSFADGLARVRLPDGYTFITAEYLADPANGTKPFGRYDLAADFIDGKARVTQNGRSFLIDKDGEEVK